MRICKANEIIKSINDDLVVKVLEKKDVLLQDRANVTNKGDCGKLLVVGGDRGMAGAPAFSALSAYRSGVGLVEVLTHQDNRIPIQLLVPEAVVSFWDEFETKKYKATALVVGVGMGKSDEARRLLYKLLVKKSVPIVIDADALNIISDNLELLELCDGNTVLTPHLREFSRLTGDSVEDIKGNIVSKAHCFSKRYKTNVVLKDAITVIALENGDVYLNTTGDSSLSKGGSGDILAGIIGSLIAQGMELEKAVPISVFLHGLAGERAGKLYSQYGALARDIIAEIPNVIKES